MSVPPGSVRGMARFKELSIDTDRDVATTARFWATAVGARAVVTDPRFPDDLDILGEEEYQGIAICRVPEPKTVKHRVHLDVYVASVDDLLAAGATMVLPAEESGFAWSVMHDPEGGEFCAFLRTRCRTTGCTGSSSTAPTRRPRPGGGRRRSVRRSTTTTVAGSGRCSMPPPDPVLTWTSSPVPEPKTVKNRVHWDVYGTVEEFLDRGATRLWDTPGWVVLADPEGNEFCVFST